MLLARIGILLAGLAALCGLVYLDAIPPMLAADPQGARSQKKALGSPATMRAVGKLTSLPGAVVGLTFSLDGKRVLVGHRLEPLRGPAGNGRIMVSFRPTLQYTLWILSPRKVLKNVRTPLIYERSLPSPTVRTLAVWAYRPNLAFEFYDLATRRRIARPSVWRWLKPGMEPLAFSLDGKVAAARLKHGTCLFHVATGKEISRIPMEDDRQPLTQAFLSGNGQVLAGPLFNPKKKEYDLAVYSVATGKLLHWFDRYAYGSALALTADGRMLALSDPKKGEVTLWETATGKQITTWEGNTRGVNDLAFSGNDKILFAASDREIVAWYVARKREAARLRGHRDKVTVLAVSPDGKRLASGGADKAVRLWDISAHAPEGKPRNNAPRQGVRERLEKLPWF